MAGHQNYSLFRPTLMDDNLTGVITQLRRLYLHLLSGASITADDLSRIIKRLEEINDERHPKTTMVSS